MVPAKYLQQVQKAIPLLLSRLRHGLMSMFYSIHFHLESGNEGKQCIFPCFEASVKEGIC